MNKQTLNIGRIVQFVPPSEDHPTANNGALVVPAIVTAVINENCVNLTVFPDGREPQCIPAVQYSSKQSAGCWHWHDDLKEVPAEAPNAENTGKVVSGEGSPDTTEQ